MADIALENGRLEERGHRWPVRQLGEVIEVNPDRDLGKEEESVYIAMEQVEPWERKVKEIRKRPYPGSGSRFKNGDTLLARITPCLENGKTAYVDFLGSGEVAHGSTEFIVLRGKDEVTDNLFVYYLTRSPRFRNFAIKRMTGSSGRQRVPANSLRTFELQLPPLDEQKKIAEVLGTFDDKIELNRQMNKTLESTARTLFKSWFVDFDPVIDNALRAGNPIPEEFADRAAARREALDAGNPVVSDDMAEHFPAAFEESDQGPIPVGWSVTDVGNTCEVVNGGTPKTKIEEYWEPPEITWAVPSDLTAQNSSVIFHTDRKISAKGLENSSAKMLPAGSVLMTSRATVGETTISMVPICTNQGFKSISAEECPSNYFMLFLLREKRDLIENLASGSTYPEINTTTFKGIDYVLASNRCLGAFDSIMEPIFSRIYANEREAYELAKTRDLLMPKLLAGDIDAKNDAENGEVRTHA